MVATENVAIDGLFYLESSMCMGAAAISQLPTPAGMVVQQVASTQAIQGSNKDDKKKSTLDKLRQGMASTMKNNLQGAFKSS